MMVTLYHFHYMIGLNFEGAIINLDGVLGIQLGLNMLGRKYSTKTIRYFDLVSGYMHLPQWTTEECIWMATAFLLSFVKGLPLYQWWVNGIFEVVNSLPRLWRGMEGQLEAGMSCLSLLHPRHSQPGHFAAACGALEAL